MAGRGNWLDGVREAGPKLAKLRAERARKVCESGLIIDADAALYEEFEAIFASSPLPPRGSSERAAWLRDQSKAALCLSGGGIRSAAFCMGALRALAGAGLLRQFHYLSTVSGGGYIAGWLLRLLTIHGVEQTEKILSGLQGVEPVKNLREFTNFLNPSPGPFSGDTMAGVVLWFRNLLVTWFIFLPALLAVSLGYFFLRDVTSLASGGFGDTWGHGSVATGQLLATAGLMTLGYGAFRSCQMLPSHAAFERRPGRTELGAEEGEILWMIVLPTLLWGMLATLAFAALAHADAPVGVGIWSTRLLALPAAAALVMVLAYCCAWAITPENRGRPAFARNCGWWVLGCAMSCSLLWGLSVVGLRAGVRWVVALGPLGVVGAHMLQSTLYIALREGGGRVDLDREWLARLNSAKLTYGLVFSFGATASLLLSLPHSVATTVAAIGAATGGPVGALLGRSAQTAFDSAGVSAKPLLRSMNVIISLAAAAFLVFLLLMAGQAVEAALPTPAGGDGMAHPAIALIAATAALVISVWLGARINANRFSLHAVYRNRLVRAFLGSARAADARMADAFTRFDPTDNARLVAMYPKQGGRALFPVIGVTLNLVGGKRTAWAERKAAPFTMTPLHCGSAELHHPDLGATGRDMGGRAISGGWTGLVERARGAYARTRTYAGAESLYGEPAEQQTGLTLGTAMTVSGAAVSPNMGYHSSPAAAFLMTLFDVRLGMWLPNPAFVCGDTVSPRSGETVAEAVARQLNSPKQSNALRTLWQEMRGRTDDQGRDVYLSDGGHFDNLGLYEMLRRRCRYILVIDVSGDPTFGHAELGTAIRRASIDLDASVEFCPPLKTGASGLLAGGFYARVSYARRPSDGLAEQTGHLLVVKSCLPEGAPAEVAAYRSGHEEFPHDSTANQFFTESQFESYRRLGEFVTAKVLGDAAALPSLFRRAERRSDAA